MTTDQKDTAQHTPGQWHRHGNMVHVEDGCTVTPRGGVYNYIAQVFDATGSATSTEAEANARLIAAAPKQLAALKEIAAILESDRLMMSDIAKADEIANAAIAKAERQS